jgi:hypothetical protein
VGGTMVDREVFINDDFLFKDINISSNNSFKEFIEAIANYAYDNIELDGIFHIEEWLEALLECEIFLSTTKKRHRDHLLHACRIALLGEYILNKELIYNGSKLKFIDLVAELFIKDDKINAIIKCYETDFKEGDLNKLIKQVWYVAALFHDIGYVYDSYIESWKSIKQILRAPHFSEFISHIENDINRFQKELTVSSMHERIITHIFKNNFDHAEIGACLISSLLIESNLICDLAAYVTECHSSSEVVAFSNNPLSFLLIILDEAQEWQRPVMGKKIRDDALAAEISKYSPYIEHAGKDPELKGIELSYNIEKVSDNLKINLNFILNYGSDSKIIEDTNFHLPLMLYIKYKNFQRLRVAEETVNEDIITPICKKYLNFDYNSVDFNVAFRFKAEVPLAHFWVRQSQILMINSKIEHNHSVVKWLNDFIGVGKNPRQIDLNIDRSSTPRILQGDFKPSILDSKDSFFRDSFLEEKELRTEFIFRYLDETGTVDIEILANRTITSSKEIPVYGFFTALGEKGLLSKMQIMTCKVNDSILDPTKEVKFFPLTEIYEYERTGNFGMYIPFKKPLIGSDEKRIEYKLHYRANIWEMDPITVIKNTRTRREIEKAEITAWWDKRLVEKYLSDVVSFNGDLNKLKKALEILNAGGSCADCSPIDPIKDDLFKYSYAIKNIKPYDFAGFLYILKK